MYGKDVNYYCIGNLKVVDIFEGNNIKGASKHNFVNAKNQCSSAPQQTFIN